MSLTFEDVRDFDFFSVALTKESAMHKILTDSTKKGKGFYFFYSIVVVVYFFTTFNSLRVQTKKTRGNI